MSQATPLLAHEIITSSGKRMNFDYPHPSMIDKKTIAHHLARINRWGGNTETSYSVAQHSMIVAQAISNPQWRIYGLLHDGAEAYIGDIPTPFKRFLENSGAQILQLENQILSAIWHHFKLTTPSKEIASAVHRADQKALATEYRDVVAGKNTCWQPKKNPLNFRIKAKPTMIAECEFAEALDEYLILAGVKA